MFDRLTATQSLKKFKADDWMPINILEAVRRALKSLILFQCNLHSPPLWLAYQQIQLLKIHMPIVLFKCIIDLFVFNLQNY